ncbi:MAG TPA: hypothetical protein PLD25_09395 [Chloroflexota bacterium]|nr:hypothetical protein [Chloroflexota bacterium]
MKQKMMEQGSIPAGQTAVATTEVWRGMRVLAQDGSPVGMVAAVVVTAPTQAISHILLGQVPPTAVYRLIPIDLLDRLDGERLWLRVLPHQITALPIHQPDC